MHQKNNKKYKKREERKNEDMIKDENIKVDKNEIR